MKLEQLKRSTPLLTRKKIKLRVDGDVARRDGFRDVKDCWEVAYGRIQIVDQLYSDAARRGDKPRIPGFGRPPVAPVQIVLKLNPVFIEDENNVIK